MVVLALVLKSFIFISELVDVHYCVIQLSGVLLFPWRRCHKILIYVSSVFLVFGKASSYLIDVVRRFLYQMIFNNTLKFLKVEVIYPVHKLLPLYL